MHCTDATSEERYLQEVLDLRVLNACRAARRRLSAPERYRSAGISARIAHTLCSTLSRAVSITIRSTSQGR